MPSPRIPGVAGRHGLPASANRTSVHHCLLRLHQPLLLLVCFRLFASGSLLSTACLAIETQVTSLLHPPANGLRGKPGFRLFIHHSTNVLWPQTHSAPDTKAHTISC